MPKTRRKTTVKALDKFLHLPFEVFYSGPISVTSYEFKSDEPVKRFTDVKAVHMEQGKAWGVMASCRDNKGPELFCCIRGLHDTAVPEWLFIEEEDDITFSYGCDYRVAVENEMIRFVDEEVEGVIEMDNCCAYSFLNYDLDSTYPDYIILDARGARIKVDADGYVLDEGGDRVDDERVFDPALLDEEEFSDYTTRELWEAKAEWIKVILNKQFPSDKNLRLSFDTE